MSELAPCGTSSAAQRHARRKEPLCAPCQEARTLYMREYRAADPKRYGKQKMRTAARSRALWRLADEHPERFEALYVEEVNRSLRAAS